MILNNQINWNSPFQKKKKNRLDEEEDRTLKWKGSAPSDMGNNYDKNLTIQEYANRGIHINLL